MNEKRLVRMRNDRMFLGVASGLAHYLSIDPAIIRLIFVLLTLAGGHGLLIYLILAVVLPEEEETVAAKANAFEEEEIVVKDAA
jgi:phage shock protein PspC (stress-responsive transcriptional regulator)